MPLVVWVAVITLLVQIYCDPKFQPKKDEKESRDTELQ